MTKPPSSADSTDARARLLIVEDEELVSLFLTEILGDFNYAVSGTAASGRAALAAAAAGPCDLALVDIGLRGDLDGIDTALALRADYGIPSVFMSGASEAALSARAERAKPLGFLQKPYTPEQLESVLVEATAQLRGTSAEPGC